MNERWRLLAHDGVGAAEGLALDEALLDQYRRGSAPRPPTLRLYTYRSHTALVGRFQHMAAEVDIEACRQTGTEFSRRPTGGGAIIMGAGQLGVAIATTAPVDERPKELLERLSAGVIAGLAQLGITGGFRGKNDIETGGKKIAGLGLYLDGEGGMLFHASVLADLDVELMLRVLQIPAAKLGDKAVAAVRERVTTATAETGDTWDGASLRDVMATGFAKALEVELEPGEVTAAEQAKADGLAVARYRADDWLFQRSPHPDATGSAVVKTGAGLVRLYLAVSGGTIKSALFAGDFNELPPEVVRFEEALRWKAVDENAIATAAREAGLTDQPELVGAVLEAGNRAVVRVVALPERPNGSCYFPEQG